LRAQTSALRAQTSTLRAQTPTLRAQTSALRAQTSASRAQTPALRAQNFASRATFGFARAVVCIPRLGGMPIPSASRITILQHCGLWHDPPARAPPKPSPRSRPARPTPARDPGFTCEADPDFLEHARREQLDQPELPWAP
jgi:hypothetical protein